MEEKVMEAAAEALLFAMGEAIPVRDIAQVLEQDTEDVRRILRRMMLRYDEEGRGIQIIELEDAFQMCTRPSAYEYLIKMTHRPKKHSLTDAALETLSIIAYKQPVTRAEIEKIRGVNSDHAVNRLVEYNLVCEAGHLDAPGRPALFATTEEFLRRFGVGSVQDLPDINPEQEAEIKAQVEEELQLKLEETGLSVLEEAAATKEE